MAKVHLKSSIKTNTARIAECVLESEFDVRILDSGVVKLFRLAQLAVEYQQFCRHYLDRSVMLLRDELAAAMQDVQRMRKEIRNKEDEIKKLRKRYKSNYRPPLPYGNENIATMILRTLSQKNDIYTSTSTGEGYLPYNKCSYCDKVFLNQLYLQSHISRRHANVNESGMEVNHLIPEKDANSQHKSETETLHAEIVTLKKKIEEFENKATERNIEKQVFEKGTYTEVENNTQTPHLKKNDEPEQPITTLDQNILLLKLEEWKKEEHARNKTEIESLRNQILENLNLMKNKDTENETKKYDDVIDRLQNTIREQAIEIATLRKELEIANSKVRNENMELRKQTEERENLWMQRAKAQTLQYEQLMQQLENIRDEARTARQLAETEHARAHQLQEKLKHFNSQTIDTATSADENFNKSCANEKTSNTKPKNHKIYNTNFPKGSLDELHRKAQELLSVVSTTSSDVSSEEKLVLEKKQNIGDESKRKARKVNLKRKKVPTPHNINGQHLEANKQDEKQYVPSSQNLSQDIQKPVVNQKQKAKTKKKNPKNKGALTKNVNHAIDNESEKAISDYSSTSPLSPIKVIRAKLNEEVNNQLLGLGADPLRNGVQTTVFTKLRNHLQQEQRVKIKKNPSYEKNRNRILAYVDSKVSKETNASIDSLQKIPSTTSKKHFNLSTVLSNVKHKALSLMKSTETMNKTERNILNDEIVKRAALLLKTPPESVSESPVTRKQSVLKSSDTTATKKTPKFNSNKKEQVAYRSHFDSRVKEESEKINTELSTSDLSKTTETDEDNTSEGSLSLIENETARNDTKTKDTVKVTTSTISHQTPNEKSIESLIKSPVRRPATANGDYSRPVRQNENVGLIRANSISKLNEDKFLENVISSNDRITKSVAVLQKENNIKQNTKSLSEENIFTRSSPSTKGVLKNAPSTSSLSKKKVIFDLDANQMKSLSASPSQSTTEKSDLKNEMKVSNLNELDLSSSENLPVKLNINKKNAFVSSRTSSKITELTQRIESQLARRGDGKPPSVGAIDILSIPTPTAHQKSLGDVNFSGGSNTSLGSSVLDDTEEDGLQHIRNQNNATQDNARKEMKNKDASDLDVSDFSIDDIIKNHIH
ncbi:Zinc finger protein DZIP1L [Eumeta japonica]|uniref:Zinc finger protein DZIP1L n=1 Tax=Eumeta variegata TaxID=151549 RepID=A0A4C1XJ80_EUMVA|nr:Zinc finger protein DZIP1L [Eumeta japonica]